MTGFKIKTLSKSYLKRVAIAALLTTGLMLSASHQAHAQWHDDRGAPMMHHDVPHHFRGVDDAHWHAGRWIHGVHGGRPGWWWVVNGQWFVYPQPVYPYPVNPYAPQIVQAPPVVITPPPPPSPGLNLIIPLNIR